MDLTIAINLDNDAFQEGCCGDELRRIFSVIAARVEAGATASDIGDANGNTVGSWQIVQG